MAANRCLKMACTLKTAGLRAKWGEICDSGVVVICILSMYDLLVFNVILGPFRVLASNWPITRKRLAVERKGVKFRTRGSCDMYIRSLRPFSG